MSWKGFSTLLLVMLASGLIAAGCGDDDNGGGDNTVSVPEVTIPTATDAEEIQENLEEQTKEGIDAAKEQCISAAEGLPEPQKSQVIDACESAK